MISALRGLRNDQVSGLLLVALAAFVAWQNRTYPLGTLHEPGPGYTPLLIAGFLGAVGLLIALRGASSPRLADTRWPEAKRAAMILIACGVATFALVAMPSIGSTYTVIDQDHWPSGGVPMPPILYIRPTSSASS